MRTARNTIVGCLLAGLSLPVSADVVEIVLQPSDLIKRGNIYIESGEIEKAKEALSRALKSSLTSRQRANAHNSFCVANIKEEAWNAAMLQCDAAIEIVPTNWRFFNNRGNVYLGLGQLEQARINYRRGLDIAPKSKTLETNVTILEHYAQKKTKRLKPRHIKYEKPT